ncbi:hypothetical protein N9B31_03085 [Mariniblastus sp.]|nr:hypothetical protein [Mariniblastus sp.]MDB4357051.1 hypothetical protein [Mariniblastus sp.]MDB4396669.1 hypothetical protein [bacterium]
MHYFGFDIGGANIKWSDLDGNAFEIPFAIWHDPKQLPSILSNITSNFPNEARVGVTMTAELADCFETKRDGVKFIVDSVTNTLPQYKPLFYQTNGRLCGGPEAIKNWNQTAASNWHATSSYLFSMDKVNDSGFVIDIGSTTTDIIPVINGSPVNSHQNDFNRLANGQLVYAGIGRTPVFGILSELNLRDSVVTIARENFATMADIFRWRKETAEELDSNATADGRPASRLDSGNRITRLVCADSSELDTDEIDSISHQAKEAFVSLIAQQLKKVVSNHRAVPFVFKTLGRGTFIAEEIIHEAISKSVVAPPSIVAYSANLALNQSVPALAVAHFRAQLDRRIS